MDEGNQRMKNSLKKGAFVNLRAAYAVNKTGIEKIEVTEEEMAKIINNILAIQQRRVHTEHEQSRKKRKCRASFNSKQKHFL